MFETPYRSKARFNNIKNTKKVLSHPLKYYQPVLPQEYIK